MVLILSLLTGCGLLNKSKRIDKTLKSTEVNKEIKVSTDTKQEHIDNTKTDVKTTSQSEENTKVYPTKGTEIKINPDGSMTFQADSIIQNARRNSDEAKSIANDVKSRLDRKVDSASNENEKMTQKQAQVIKESKPNILAVLMSKIGWGIAFAIVVIAVFIYFRIKRR